MESLIATRLCGRVVERYRDKRTQPKRLDAASMRDPSLNLPQGGDVDNRPRINQPHSQAPPKSRSSDGGGGDDGEGEKW
jgi:hypothetical protein